MTEPLLYFVYPGIFESVRVIWVWLGSSPPPMLKRAIFSPSPSGLKKVSAASCASVSGHLLMAGLVFKMNFLNEEGKYAF